MALAPQQRSPFMTTVEMAASENVARALSAMYFDEVDDHAAASIARHELHAVSKELEQLASGELSASDVSAAAERLAGIATALIEIGLP